MPFRDELTGATLSVVLDGVTYLGSVSKVLGTKQSISALNNVGRFVPGIYRANQVVLEKWVCSSSPCGSMADDLYLGHRGRVKGDLAAFLTQANNLGPLSSNYGSFYGAWDATAAGHAYQKAMAAMNESELDLGVMLGELRETIAGLREPFSALRKWLSLLNTKNFRRSWPKRQSDTLNMLTGSWLEWRYGIMPLIYSIQDIIEQIEAQTRAINGKILRKRGTVKWEKDYRSPTANTTAHNCYNLSGSSRINVKHRYTTSVFYRYVKPLTWLERYGMDKTALPGIAWELAKLSFVWDWFFSVGDWLQSLRISDARQMLGVTTSQKSVVSMETTMESCKFYNVVPVKNGGSTHTVVYSKLDRRLNPTPPIGPVVNKALLSVKRQLDAVSLIWQSLPKIRR